ncbi:alpha/beta hydrolase family protein [Aquimarina sp. M1]
MKTSIITICLFFLTLTVISQNITGIWNGAIEVDMDTKFNFIFNIQDDGKAYQTTVDIPTQRVNGIKALKTLITADSLIIDLSNVGMKYSGKLNANRTLINGKLVEGLNTFSLNLSRNSMLETSKSRRPQEPLKPYSYIEEKVSFVNKDANITLAGTFTRPKKNEKHPVVILISGSGPQDRDETISQHKPFLILADYLTKQGIAVLRYDDRGFGESTGNHSNATTYDFSLDVISAMNYLRTRDDVDVNKIGLIGHSEGGIIAPLVANKTNDVAFIVSLAGTGISGTELSVIQSKTMRPFPVPDELAYENAIREAIKIAKQHKNVSEIKRELKTHYNETIAPILKNLGVPEVKVNEIVNGLVEIRTTKWIRYFYDYNPADEYEKVNCPVLSLNGSLDTQVEAKINQAGLREALEKGKNKDYEIIELKGLNHLFQNAKTGKMDEYSNIEETFSVKALNIISDWILKRT